MRNLFVKARGLMFNWQKILFYVFVGGIILVANAFRFYALDRVPYGFHVDEMVTALNAYCLSTEGTDVRRNPYPLFPETMYGSPKPPVYIYPAILWGKIFGFEAPSFRAFTALSYVFAIAGLFFWLRRVLGLRAAMWAAVAASISPWPWMYSRMGYESIFELAFIVWGLYFFFHRDDWRHILPAAIFFACAIYVYPAARLQVPFIIFSAFLYRLIRKETSWKSFGLLLVMVGILLIPLGHELMGNKGLSRRLSEVAIFSPDVLTAEGLKGDFAGLWQLFWKNYGKHVTWKFLFFKGGDNLIQTTQAFGILGWFDILGIVAAFLLGLRCLLMRGKGDHLFARHGWFIALCISNFLFAIVPSALTNVEIPHALRMMSGAIFVFAMTGLFLSETDKILHWGSWGSLLVAGVFLVVFLRIYFLQYPQNSKGMFWFWSQEQARAAKTNEDWFKFMVAHRGQDYHVMYYLIFYKGGEGCNSSRTKWELMQKLLSSRGL
ncbi:MAG: glycosyltransferase family 39 protein [Candidatus Omnitrophica bacterium]|nr:glycosyltransferase family 39 protein [Candidatus Omnitrophota bacterium]